MKRQNPFHWNEDIKDKIERAPIMKLPQSLPFSPLCHNGERISQDLT